MKYSYKYMLCALIFISTCFCVPATSYDGISENFSYEITENFGYCWDNKIVCTDTDNPEDTSFLSAHHYGMMTMLKAFSNSEDEQIELDKIGYCCRQFYFRVKNMPKRDTKYYNIVVLSDLKREAPIITELERLKEQDFETVNIISEAPVKCLAYMEHDCLIFVTYSMFDDINDALSVSKSFVKQCFSY